MINKRRMIIWFSIFGTLIIGGTITMTIVIIKKDNNQILSNQQRFSNLNKKEIVLNENSDLDLSKSLNQTKVINEVKKRAWFLNDIQKNSIKLITKVGSISYKNPLEIVIEIIFNQKKESFKFKFKRLINNYDRFNDLSKKDHIIKNKNKDIDLSTNQGQEIIKKYLYDKTSFLLKKEKNTIKLLTKKGLINNRVITNIKFSLTIENRKHEYTFKFIVKSNELNLDKFINLKNKLDNVNLTKTLSDQVDLDLLDSQIQIKIKQFIFVKIDEVNINKLTQEEKESILLATTLGVITHTKTTNVDFVIIFGSNTKIYSFKLKRSKSINEKFNILKSKFDKVNLIQKINGESDLDLSVIQIQIKIKQFIFDKIDEVNFNNKLTQDEKNAILLATKSNIINYRNLTNVDFVIVFGSKTKIYKFKLTRIKSKKEINKENFDKLKIKFDNFIKNNSEIILQNQSSDFNLFLNQDRLVLKNLLVNKIINISAIEKNGINISTKLGIISYTNFLITNVNILFGSHLQTYSFKIKRIQTRQEMDKKFNTLKVKFDKVHLFQKFNDESDLDLSDNQIQTKVKQFIFDKIDEVNFNNKLTQEEKQAISLTTISGIITYSNATSVNITITLGPNTKIYTFILARTKSKKEINKENFDKLKIKFDNFIKNNSEIILQNQSSDFNLFLNQDRLVLKNLLVNKIINISAIEKNGINISTKLGIISYTNFLITNVNILFGSHLQTYSFKIKRIQTRQEMDKKFNTLKVKFDKVHLFQKFNDESDLDLSDSQIQTKVKQFIFNKIDEINFNNKLTQDEKNAISITTTSGTINHTSSINVAIRIAFGVNNFDYIFKLTRIATDEEKFNILKAKVDKINSTQTLSERINLDLSNSTDQTTIKNFIINKIDEVNNDNKLTKEEKNVITLVSKIGIITYINPTNVEVKIAFDSNAKNYVFNLSRSKTVDDQKVLNLKAKVDKIVNLNLIVDSMQDLNLTIVSHRDIIVKNYIISKIIEANNNQNLKQNEIDAILIPKVDKIITHTFKKQITISISFGSSNLKLNLKISREIKNQELFDEIKLIWGKITYYLYQKRNIKYSKLDPKDPSTWNFPPIPVFDFTWSELFPKEKRQNHASQWLNIDYKRKIFLRKFIKIMFEINDSYTKKFLPPEWKQGSDPYNWLPSQWRDAMKLEKHASWMIDCFLPEGTIWTNTYYDWINGKKVLKHDSYGTRNFYIFINVGSLKIQYQYLINMKLPKAV